MGAHKKTDLQHSYVLNGGGGGATTVNYRDGTDATSLHKTTNPSVACIYPASHRANGTTS